jgi:type III restriction enzyme
VGKPGEKIQNVISVGMLSEGWDAKTVTHIMGLRAFTSQLLCEQVIGRGLRRTTYEVNPETGLFEAEYVNIFGVPFTFLPHESHEGGSPQTAVSRTTIKPDDTKKAFEISWPNVIRIDYNYKPILSLDIDKVKPLVIDANETKTIADLAPVVDGKPDVTKISSIDLEKLGNTYRTQKIVFEAVSNVFDEIRPAWKGNKEYLLSHLITLWLFERALAVGDAEAIELHGNNGAIAVPR